MAQENVVFTNVDQDTWLDSYSLNPSSANSNWSISKRTLRGGLSDGVDVVTLDNGKLAIDLLPTRGMGIWRGRFAGKTLGWDSPVARPVHPKFVNQNERSGLGWLTGFNELICRCGLSSNGPPGKDTVLDNNGNPIETDLTLHGKIANIPAHHVEASADEDQGVLSVTGIVDESMMFGPQLQLRSTLQTSPGSNSATIIDEVTNLGGQPTELQLLYHTNVGRPLLEAGGRMRAPVAELAPRDAVAAEAIDTYKEIGPPIPGFTEQCYFMTLASDTDDQTMVLLMNAGGDFGVSLQFSVAELPCFTMWKNTQADQDGYVVGLEPATNFPNLKTFERDRGRVITLQPRQKYRTSLTLTAYDSAEEINRVSMHIANLQGDATLGMYRMPHSRFSPQ